MLRFRQERLHGQAARSDSRRANVGDVVDCGKIQRHGNAHANIGVGGARIRHDIIGRSVDGKHLHRAVFFVVLIRFARLRRGDNVYAPIDERLSAVSRHVERKRCRNRNAPLAGFRLLAAVHRIRDLFGRYVARAVRIGKPRRALHHVIRLAVRALFFLIGVILGAFAVLAAFRALAACDGDILDGARRFRADTHAFCAQTAQQVGLCAVVDHREGKGTAHGDSVARSGGIRLDRMRRRIFGRDHRRAKGVFAALDTQRFAGKRADIRHSAATGNIQRK